MDSIRNQKTEAKNRERHVKFEVCLENQTALLFISPKRWRTLSLSLTRVMCSIGGKTIVLIPVALAKVDFSPC